MIVIIYIYTPLAPQLENMVINTCSFMLKSLGFNENDHFVNGFEICFFGSFAAMNFPIRKTRIYIVTEPINS
jgi:hypothetical protein